MNTVIPAEEVTERLAPAINSTIKDACNTYKKAIDRAAKSIPELSKYIHDDVSVYTPYATGKLDSSLSVTQSKPTEYKVHYSAKYASYALNPYSEMGRVKHYNTSVHPLATGNPVEQAEKTRGKEWLNEYWEFLKEKI